MLKEETITTDILVIGSGITGMIAAIEARKRGARVTLVSKSKLGKESSTSVARTFAFGSPDDTRGDKIPGYDNKPGKNLEYWPLVRTVLEEAPKQIENLIKMGVPMVKIPGNKAYEGVPAYRPEGSDVVHGGAIVLDCLVPIAARMGVRVVEDCQIISLLRGEDKVLGASGLLPDGGWLSIYARAVVLATGGAAGMSEVSSSPPGVCGNGYAMALKAGLYLKNLELNEFYPVGLPTPTGQYVHCAPVTLMMKKAWLRNDGGEDVVKKHFGISLQDAMPMTATRFDWVPRAVALELERGKVWLDLTRVPQQDWDRLPERNWKQIRRTQVDMKKTPLPIMPMSHAFKGGLTVSTRMQTSLEGLYAAGEVAAGWMPGGRWLGHLTCCLTTGAIAGRSAAADVKGGKAPPTNVADGGLAEAQDIVKRDGRVSPEEVGDEIRRVLYRHAGPVKSGPSLEEALQKLQALEAKAQDLRCTDGKGLKDVLEAKAMLLVAKAVMKAALMRKESRGAFYRHDFPARDDEHWLRPVMVSYEGQTGDVKVEPGGELALGV